MNITEKVAFVKGLAEGMEIDKDKKEGKLMCAIIDALEDLALSISDLEEGYDDICDQVDAIDEDLDSLEQDFYEGLEDDEDFFYEVTCPTCNETISLSEEMLLDGQVECPNCGESLEFDLDDICEEGCDCGSECDCTEGDSCGCH